MYQFKKKTSAKIGPHMSSALGDQDMIFEKLFLSSSIKLVDTNPAGNLES